MLPLNTSGSPARAGGTSKSSPRSKRLVAGVALAGTAALLLLMATSSRRSEVDPDVRLSSSSPHAPPAKQGAGLVLWRDDLDAVLLLQRRSRHHDRAWGLPGGNVERSDQSLLDAAEREATEEMGGLPSSFSVLTRIDAVRGGKKGEKAYSAFVLRVPSEAAEAFSPVLNRESRAWRWVSREGASWGGGGGVGVASRSGTTTAATARKEGGGAEKFVLHPVAADLLTPGTQSRALLDEAVDGARSGGGGGGGGGE